MSENTFNKTIKSCNKADKDDRHVPCWSIRDFAELKDVKYDALAKRMKKSKLTPKFTQKRTRYYSIHDLNEWYESKLYAIDTH